MQNEKLKPCPFCGGTQVNLAVNYLGQWYVMCRSCGAEIWGADIEKLTEKGAVKAWNKRAEAGNQTSSWEMLSPKMAKCSACGHIQTTNGEDRTMKGLIFYANYKYCPNCGKKMERKEL